MIRISKLTDYAMLILNYMSHHAEDILSTTALAERLQLTPPTVSKILKILAEGKLVHSVRGAEGGYRLSKLGSEITLMDIIAAMEGDLAMMACCTQAQTCSVDAVCTMRENWRHINTMVKALLAKFTILDMSTPLPLEGIIHVQ